jgi:hypothetical protein
MLMQPSNSRPRGTGPFRPLFHTAWTCNFALKRMDTSMSPMTQGCSVLRTFFQCWNFATTEACATPRRLGKLSACSRMRRRHHESTLWLGFSITESCKLRSNLSALVSAKYLIGAIKQAEGSAQPWGSALSVANAYRCTDVPCPSYLCT